MNTKVGYLYFDKLDNKSHMPSRTFFDFPLGFLPMKSAK